MRGAFDSNGIQYVWDSTSLKTVDSCDYKYHLQILEGWQPKGEAVHLRFGGHYATALEHYYKRVVVDGMTPDEAVIDVVWEALRDTWDRPQCDTCQGSGEIDNTLGGEGHMGMSECPDCHGKGTVGDGAPWDSLHNLKTRESLIRSIVWYFDHFADDSLPLVVTAEGTPLVEYSYLLPVDDGIIFSGHLDRVVTYADNPWVMDQKTTGTTLSPRFFEGFSPDHQMSMYSFAGKAILSQPVAGVIIDAAQIAVGFTRFERGFTARSQSQLNEWYDDTMRLIEHARAITKEQYFRRNPMACGNYGGCPFRGICARGPEVRPMFLKGGFDKTAGWDPAARR